MKALFRVPLVLCVLSMLALTGCFAKNDIRLIYPSAEKLTAPSATAPRVTVVQFEDKRGTVALGQRKDGTAFTTASGVPGWVTQAFADELARQGVQVAVALSMAQAQISKPDCIVSGSIDKLWLSEKNISSYQAEVSVQVHKYGAAGEPVVYRHSAQQEKSGIPGMKLAEETLSGALADALTAAASALAASLR